MRGALTISSAAAPPAPPASTSATTPVDVTATIWTTIGTVVIDPEIAPAPPAAPLTGAALTCAAVSPATGGTGEIRLVGCATGTVLASRSVIATAPSWQSDAFSSDDSTAFVQARIAPTSPATTLTVWSTSTTLDA